MPVPNHPCAHLRRRPSFVRPAPQGGSNRWCEAVGLAKSCPESRGFRPCAPEQNSINGCGYVENCSYLRVVIIIRGSSRNGSVGAVFRWRSKRKAGISGACPLPVRARLRCCKIVPAFRFAAGFFSLAAPRRRLSHSGRVFRGSSAYGRRCNRFTANEKDFGIWQRIWQSRVKRIRTK